MKIHIVKWQDATGGSNIGWRDIKELKNLKTATVLSCGTILKETENYIIICPHFILGEDKEITEGDAEIIIPKSWVMEQQCIGEF